MNKEVKALWLEALRSGEYQQGPFRLRSESNTYCCLGVLCDLAVKAGVVEWSYLGDHYGIEDGDEMNISSIPLVVEEWSGVTEVGDLAEPTPVRDGREVYTLVSLNDSHGCTFEQIADVIEEQF